MSSRILSFEHPLDAAARAYALLGRISAIADAAPGDGSVRECLRALAEHERQLHELAQLLQELDGVRRELAAAEPTSETRATREALEAVLVPVESAARDLLARAGDLASRRRALTELLETVNA